MIRTSLAFLAATAAVLAPAAAFASSSQWEATEGARVRLVSSGLPDATGTLLGVLEIELEPGWKTYWREPGGSGVPPSIDVSGNPHVVAAALDFPAPERHFDGDLSWAGYSRSVAFPVTFSLAPGEVGPIEASVFLGICETICVPLQARLTLDPASAPDDMSDAANVRNGFDVLPPPASETFGVKLREVHDGKAVFAATLPEGSDDADLFIAGDGYIFSVPERSQDEGGTIFTVTVERPPETSGIIHYTLVTSAGAVRGELPAF